MPYNLPLIFCVRFSEYARVLAPAALVWEMM